MADWDISPTGVASVLKKVGTHAEELGKELNTLSTHAESAVTATQSNLIGTTISEYFEKTEGPRLKKISSLVSAACTGVRDATKAYLRGDEEMAADAQDKAIKAGAAQMSTPVNPDGIPGANLNPDGIVEAATAIRKVATTIDTKTSEIDTDWAGLSTVYSAPESHDVLILMKQVATDGDASSKALSTVADALDKFAEDVRPIKKTLDELRVRAQTFVKDQVNDTDRWIPWDQDLGAVNDNNDIINKVNDQVEALMVAERTCANSIRALYGAQALHAITTENDPLGYGFDDLSGAKELPWGTPTDHLEGCVGQTATFVFKDFLWEGVIVGGAWGTVQGLGTLVLGYNPNDGSWLQPSTYGAAWGQVGHIAAGSFVYGNPVTLTALLVDRGMRASGNKGFLDQATVNFTNDCDQSLIGAGKGMIAWDKWSTDPGTAAGESVFNLGTLLIPGGGEAVAGVKGLGGAAKILGTTGKVLEVLDAGAWAAKGAGALGGATVKGLAHAFEGLDLGKLSSTVPDLRLDDLTNKAGDADLPSYKPGSDVPESKFPDENYSGSTGDAGRASDSPSPHSDADPDAPHTGDDPANPHGNGDSGTPHADTTTSLPDSSASTPHDGDATTPHSDHDTGTAHSDTDSATPHTEHDSAPHEGDAHAPHEGDLASGHGHGDSPDGPGTHPTDGMHDASDVIAAENRPEVHQTADPENPGFDTDGHRMLDDRGDGRLHYQLDPENTFRDVNERLHDSHGFAVDPYTGHRFSYDDLADQGRAATHTMQDPSSWADQVADWSRTREKPQAILNEIRSRAEDMGIDPTGKTPKQIAAEAQKLADKGAFGTEEALLTRDMARDYDTARQSLNLRSETMGESAALDVARGRGDTVVIQGPAGANRLDVVSLGHGPDGYSLHVFEAKGGDSPSLGGRNTAGRSYAQQGSATYLADLVSGRNTDPRLTELVHQWQTDPAYADLVKHLHSDGIPVTYDLVNARTNGKVRISQFGLGETFRLRLGPHGLEVTRQGTPQPMTTWNTADPAKVIDAIKTLVGADWPKTRIEAQDLLTMHGWGRDHRGSFVTNFGIRPGYALVSQSNNAAVDVSFALCDVFPDDDEPAKADFVHDLFTEYTGHFTQAWGKPIKRITKPDPEIWWNSGNDCIVALRRSTIAPYVDFYTPNGVPLLKISIT